MTIYFSATENGFYDDALKADYIAAGTWPDDVKELSEQCYQYLLKGQTDGKVITANEYGQPVLSDPPAQTKEQAIAEAGAQKDKLMSEASSIIAPLEDAANPDINIATDDEKTQLVAWRKYRVLLSRIDTSLAPDIVWPSKP